MNSTGRGMRVEAVGEGAAVYWGLLLHFYQPPHQLLSVLRRVVEESYLPLIEVFRQHPHARATVNMNGVLTDMLWEAGFREVIAGLRELAERGQIEFTGSGKYHPILPLLPRGEQERQIELNAATNRRIFGEVYRPRGFFPPEMCYGPDIVEPILDAGHEWLIASGIACPAPWTAHAVYQVLENGRSLGAIFRDDILSNRISFRSTDAPGYLGELRRIAGTSGDGYVVTAMDAETFGHHIRHWETEFLGAAFELLRPAPRVAGPRRQVAAAAATAAEAPISSATLSEIVDRFPAGEAVRPHPSSWSTSAEELADGNPYPLWDDPHNALHGLLWKHLRLALDLTRAAGTLADTEDSRRFAHIARALLDQAEHSCQWWWASRRPMWDINMVHRGLMEQQEAVLNAARAIRLSGASQHEQDEQLYRFAASRALVERIMDLLVET